MEPAPAIQAPNAGVAGTDPDRVHNIKIQDLIPPHRSEYGEAVETPTLEQSSKMEPAPAIQAPNAGVAGTDPDRVHNIKIQDLIPPQRSKYGEAVETLTLEQSSKMEPAPAIQAPNAGFAGTDPDRVHNIKIQDIIPPQRSEYGEAVETLTLEQSSKTE